MILRQFIIYCGVGAVSTGAHFATLTMLVELIDTSPIVASACGFSVGALVSYLLNYRLTFQSVARHSRTLPRFLAVALAGCALNTLLMLAGIEWLQLHYLLAQCIATSIVLFLTFSGSRFWTFRP